MILTDEELQTLKDVFRAISAEPLAKATSYYDIDRDLNWRRKLAKVGEEFLNEKEKEAPEFDGLGLA